MLHEFGNSGSKVSGRWHEIREHARETAMSEEEFSDIEKERYDLETAQITGDTNDDSFTSEPLGREPTDIRDTNPRI